MGAKGPAIILVFGVVGLAVMAMFANMLTQTPEARAVLEFREALAAHAPVVSSSLGVVEDEHELKLYVKPAAFRAPAQGQLPPGFEKVPSLYRRHRPPVGKGRFLRLELLEGDPEGDARSLWSTRLDLHGRDAEIQQQLSKLLGQTIRINQRRSDGHMGLAVGLRTQVKPAELDRAAVILGGYRYGGWQQLMFNLAGRWVYYDGDGKPIDAPTLESKQPSSGKASKTPGKPGKP